MGTISHSDTEHRLRQVRAVRAQLHQRGPVRLRPGENDFERVSLPAQDCDFLRDALIAERACTVIEVGLAYASSALAIGEALLSCTPRKASHVIIDPFQATSYANAGWDAICAAGLEPSTTLVQEPSSIALSRLVTSGFVADAAFVDGSHRFHEVFVDLYFLRKLVRAGGLIILDDTNVPSVARALGYYDQNLGWQRVDLAGRLQARRLPAAPFEPDFTDFKPF